MLQRAEGYRRCLHAAGLYDPRLEMLSPERSSIALGARLFEEMLQRMPDIDAIFFCNDDIAQGGLLAAHRLGVAVPSRIAVAGFNDLAGSDQMVPALTTVRTPRSEVGREGANMLLGMMRGSAGAPGSIQLGYELVVREST
ncbi:HTH-type transcriptional regulator GntR [compost metagenome]